MWPQGVLEVETAFPWVEWVTTTVLLPRRHLLVVVVVVGGRQIQWVWRRQLVSVVFFSFVWVLVESVRKESWPGTGSVSIHDAVVKLYLAIGRHGVVFENDFDFLIHVRERFNQGFSFLRYGGKMSSSGTKAMCLAFAMVLL